MVQFKENSFVIEVPTGVNPIESWLTTHDELIDLLQSQSVDMINDIPYHALELLRNMMPDIEMAKRMIK